MVLKELIVFSFVFIFALIIAALFHLYYVFLRKKLSNKKSFNLIVFLDLIFGIIAGFLCFLLLLKLNYGNFRFYILLSLFTAFYFYYKIVNSLGG